MLAKKKFQFSSSLLQRLASGAFWTLLGNLASRLASVASMVLLARHFGAKEFGEFAVVQSTLLTLQTVSGLGLGWAATRYVAKYRVADVPRIGRVVYFAETSTLIAAGVCALSLFVASGWIAEYALHEKNLKLPLQVAALSLLLIPLNQVKSGVLMGLGEFKYLACFNACSAFWTFFLIIGGGWLFGVLGATSAFAIASLLDFLLIKFISVRIFTAAHLKINRKGAFAESEIFWKFGLPAVLGSSIFQGSIWLSGVFLVRQPHGFSEMAYYNAANQWFSALMFLPTIVSQAAVPLLSEKLGMRQFSDVNKIFKSSLIANLLVVGCVVVIGSIASPWIMSLYGTSYSSEWLTLVLLLFAAGFAAIQAPAAQVISSSGRMWFALIMQAMFAIIFCSASSVLVDFGSEGLAIARVFAYVAYAGASFMFAAHLFKKMNAS